MDKLTGGGLVSFEASIANPVGEAIAAEARQPHQFDILRVMAMAKMPDQSAEGCGGGSVIKLVERIIFSGHR